jgi:hypothetical protein
MLPLLNEVARRSLNVLPQSLFCVGPDPERDVQLDSPRPRVLPGLEAPRHRHLCRGGVRIVEQLVSLRCMIKSNEDANGDPRTNELMTLMSSRKTHFPG